MEHKVSKIPGSKYYAKPIGILVYEDKIRLINESEIHSWDIDKVAFLSAVRMMLITEGYDVVKRKPELKLCPSCEDRTYLIAGHSFVRDDMYQVTCDACGMTGAMRDTLEDAVEAWNKLPRNEDLIDATR